MPIPWRAMLLAAISCPALAHAEDAAAPPAVDTVIVTGARRPEDPPIVAEARARLSETPGGVSVISAESYERRFAVGLDDMLRDAPGVYAQRKWGGDIRISIRGSGIGNANHNRGLLLAQDGVPLNEADGLGDSQIADALTTRFTEVYRGGNALRFGGALLGGAINMVTPTGKDAGFDNRVSGVPASTFNAGETIHQGIEAALDWGVAAGWRLRQTWTWSDFRFRDDPQYGDNRLPIVPRHFYRAELRYQHAAGWFIAPSLEWSASDIWIDYRNTTKAPSYAVWNLGAGYAVSDRVNLFLDIRNLADKDYVSNVQAQIAASAASAAYWPGDGRSLFGGLTWSF